MKTAILAYTGELQPSTGKFYPTIGNILPINQIFAIFASVLVSIERHLRSWCTIGNVSLAFSAIAGIVGILAAAVVSETDSIESRLTLAICVVIGVASLAISFKQTKTIKY